MYLELQTNIGNIGAASSVVGAIASVIIARYAYYFNNLFLDEKKIDYINSLASNCKLMKTFFSAKELSTLTRMIETENKPRDYRFLFFLLWLHTDGIEQYCGFRFEETAVTFGTEFCQVNCDVTTINNSFSGKKVQLLDKKFFILKWN